MREFLASQANLPLKSELADAVSLLEEKVNKRVAKDEKKKKEKEQQQVLSLSNSASEVLPISEM